MPEPYADIEAYLEAHAAERLADYLEFLRIPSISTLPEHAPDMRRAAEFLAGRLRTLGLEGVALHETGGHPLVYGAWQHAAGAPTVLVYGHYDVQPVDPLEEWVTPPFEPRVQDGRVFARGAADDKGQVHLHVAAAEAMLAVRGGFPVNLKYLFEGEEEDGSEHLATWLEAHQDLVAADLVIVSDTDFFEGNLPMITIGLRGLMYLELEVTGPRLDLHSGQYGGTVRNPAHALASIIAGLHGPDGRVAVPGFYDDVRPLSQAERTETARLPFDEAEYAAAIGVPALPGEAGYTVLERRGARPTLDVNGLRSGFQGAGSKTVIPAAAHAKISCRLVPDQDPARIFEQVRQRILELVPAGVSARVTLLSSGRPSLTPLDHPATRAAARALEAVFGRPPLFGREGGSIPVVASFESILGLPSVLLGFANPDCQAHAPNESMRLDNYEGGLRTVVRLWDELRQLPG